MKVGIIGVGDIRHMTMISFFTRLFDKKRIEYNIICINRYQEKTDYFHCSVFEYAVHKLQDKSKLQKLYHFLRFKQFAINIIKSERYDFLIIWNENTALLFADYLVRNYSKSYCVCIRDLTFKRTGFISRVREAVIRKSAFSTLVAPISLDYPKGYRYELMISTNQEIIQKCRVRNRFVPKGSPIRISFIGNVRFQLNDFEFIQKFANDERYILQFFGHGANKYKTLLEKYNINNVVLEGDFLAEDTPKYLERTDILNCYYGPSVPYWKYYLPIKFGYAAPLHIPAIVSSGSLLGSFANEYKFSFQFNVDDTLIADNLWNWYHSINSETFIRECNKYINYVDEVNHNLEEKVINVLEKHATISEE